MGFAHAHLLFGGLLIAQSLTGSLPAVPASLAGLPLTLGLVLLYLAITGPGADYPVPLPAPEGFDHKALAGITTFALRNKQAISQLRSEYEHQIKLAARQEERARLARDLHDAVKQQLFVIQTAAATAQARFDTDADGARGAVDQVRSAAREAMTEMEAMLDQLQAAPLGNDGLVASIKKQCEALEFRTGARVTFELGTLPPDTAADPGTRQAIFRVAQEALANVARHSRAAHVSVSLGSHDGQLVLTVRDDGMGFVPADGPRGMGMANIAARATEVGGNLEMMSAPNRGTTLRLSVPMQLHGRRGPYVRRAIGWSAILGAAVLHVVVRGSTPGHWVLPALMLIAGIAAARYSIAVYRVHRSVNA
jgi:signal transduction histidine kinase